MKTSCFIEKETEVLGKTNKLAPGQYFRSLIQDVSMGLGTSVLNHPIIVVAVTH